VRLVRLFEFEREVEGGTLLPCWEETIALLNHRFPKKKRKSIYPTNGAVGSRTSGSETYRCKDNETLQNEMRGEYDQEIDRRILHDLVQDRRNRGWS
jgi:hypothetical protein